MLPDPLVENPSFLVDADLAGEFACFKEVRSWLKDERYSAHLYAALRWPYLRPLMEFYNNNAVDARGGLTLLALGYAKVDKVVGSFELELSKDFSIISLTDIGMQRIDDLYFWYQKEAWFSALEAGITDYACRDLGAGVCVGKEFLAIAMEYNDTEVLQRVVDPTSLKRQFAYIEREGVINSQRRMSLEALWSPRSSCRTSAKVVVPIFSQDSGFWNENDCDAADDVIDDLNSLDAVTRALAACGKDYAV